jgi:hypothetical protein
VRWRTRLSRLLNAILGWARLLAGEHLDPLATKRAIEIIERNTRVQAQLTRIC